jgi:hypothetical protein
MSRPAVRWRVVMCGLAVALGAAGCTSGSAAGPTTTSPLTFASASVIDPSTASVAATASSPVASLTPSVTAGETSSAPPASLDPAAQEAADRAAIEAQWVKFWQVYTDSVRTPIEQRSSALDTVSVDPIRTRLLEAAKRFDDEGLDYWGSVITHPYWVEPVNGQQFAVMRDCQDQSHYGSLVVQTGAIRSVGVENNSLQAGFVLGPDGIWRVQTLNHLGDVPC